MSMKAAFALFAKKTGCERRIPFEVSVDPFYGDENLAQITIGTRVSNCERVEEIFECKLDERYAADGGKSVLKELKCSKGEARPPAHPPHRRTPSWRSDKNDKLACLRKPNGNKLNSVRLCYIIVLQSKLDETLLT